MRKRRFKKSEQWVIIEKAYNTFPQTFATTYDNQFVDNYYQRIGIKKPLKKHLLIFEKTTANLCNIKENFEEHIQEIFEKVIKEPKWAIRVNAKNKKYLEEFYTHIKELEKIDFRKHDLYRFIKEFFRLQQIAHASAWPMAIVDWDKSLFSHYLKNQLLKLKIKSQRVEVIFSELTTSYPPHSREGRQVNYKVKADQNLSTLFKIARETIKLKKYRKQIFDQAFKVLFRIWKAISEETGIETRFIKFMYPWEAQKLFQGEITENELKKRSIYHIFYSDKNGKTILSDREAKNFVKKLEFYKEGFRKIQEIRGSIAFKGLTRGKVKIVNTKNDAKKVRNGEIIVSHMIEPSFTTAFRKCAGIITDLGGITCHAAIVAREIKKPCIIGTKIATRILQDGDLVEIDANKGIIKKLN